jgi:pyruvate formate lyase activating enzyme
MVTGIVFDIRRYCVHDGPGIRTTVFLKGCPMRCWWCHNPEGRASEKEIIYRPSRCIRCGSCVVGCPHQAVHSNGKPVQVDPQKCQKCGCCETVCPTGSLELIGKEIQPAELVAEIEKDRAFFEESDGGATFSGGEPLLQPDFLLECLQGCRRRGIHTVVDTCGYATPATMERIRPFVDLFLYDIKFVDGARHRKYTGVSNEMIVENLGNLAMAGSKVVVVLPLIPGINDDDQNVDDVAEYAQDLGLGEISVLPFHHAAAGKFADLGIADPMVGVAPPSEMRIKEVEARLRMHGLNVRVGKR